ncbi:hypothetical protein ACH5RR_018445, partial [Cinchona calisaya]
MFGNSIIHVSASSVLFPSYLIYPISQNGSVNLVPCLNTSRRPNNRVSSVKDTSSTNTGNSQQQPTSSSEPKSLLAVVLDIPKNLWRQTLGLSAVLLALSLAWLRGFQLRSEFRKYLAVFEFEQACGICTGTLVRIRGVNVGSVIRVNPSLKSIEAVVEVDDDKVIIPHNLLVEVNQSGLLMETLIDITPGDPILTPSIGPLDPDCVKEGLIVCDRQKLKGYQGVSLDALVGIFTRLEVQEIGIANTYSLAEWVALVIEEAQPLLSKIKAMAEDVQPLLAEVCDSGLLKEVESLMKNLTQASEDMRKVHSSVLTPENMELIQKSIYSLIFTLKNIENISSDILGFTGDEATRRNLKLLIKSLS